tara:strand:+ start:200 stop:556 length:357 start_codon:yes stop_codon:yes gene_type:complete
MGVGNSKVAEVVGRNLKINREVARAELAAREAAAAAAELKNSDDNLGLLSSGGRIVSKRIASGLSNKSLEKLANRTGGGKRKKIKSKKRTKRNKQKTKRRKNRTKKNHTKKNRTRKRR